MSEKYTIEELKEDLKACNHHDVITEFEALIKCNQDMFSRLNTAHAFYEPLEDKIKALEAENKQSQLEAEAYEQMFNCEWELAENYYIEKEALDAQLKEAQGEIKKLRDVVEKAEKVLDSETIEYSEIYAEVGQKELRELKEAINELE